MCGRFQLSVKGKQISERFNIEVFDEMYSPSYNSAPSQKLPVIINESPKELSFFNWGLISKWAKSPNVGFKNINTRAETINIKPSFKNAFKTRRCLIPANGFYEWKKDSNNIPYRIFLKNNELFAMAGIWESWKDAEERETHTFSIITTSANTTIKHIHNRMPVILKPEDEQTWLNENNQDILLSLLNPYTSIIESYPVSKKVNSPKNNSPEIAIREDDRQQRLF